MSGYAFELQWHWRLGARRERLPPPPMLIKAQAQVGTEK